MRIELDRERCSGHGRCYTLAPEVYDADDDGYGLLPTNEVPPGLEQKARLGALNCPEEAITVTEP